MEPSQQQLGISCCELPDVQEAGGEPEARCGELARSRSRRERLDSGREKEM